MQAFDGSHARIAVLVRLVVLLLGVSLVNLVLASVAAAEVDLDSYGHTSYATELLNPQSGTVHEINDANDVYRVYLGVGDTFTPVLSWVGGGFNLDLYMKKPAATHMNQAEYSCAASNGNANPETFSYTATEAGYYFLGVSAWTAPTDAAYTLTYTLTKAVAADTTAPTVTFDPAATYIGSAGIPISATDNVGVAQLHYMFSTDGVTFGETQHVTGSSTTINVSALGQHWIKVFAHDQAGNYGVPITRSFTVVAAPVAIPKLTLLSEPNAPTTMYKGKAKTISGYLKPRHTAGTFPVRIYKYRYVSGKWRSYGYARGKASNYSTYTKYTKAFSLPYAGKWRLRAVAPADSLHATTYSTYDYVTVK